MKTRVVATLAMLLTACGFESREADVTAQLVVSTEIRDRVCTPLFGNKPACYVDGVVYIRESAKLPADLYTLVIPKDVWVPAPSRNDDYGTFQRCGYELAIASQFDIEPTQAVSLCHEAGHVLGMTHN